MVLVQYDTQISISSDILLDSTQTAFTFACLVYINADILDRNPRVTNCIISHITMTRTFCGLYATKILYLLSRRSILLIQYCIINLV